MKGVGTIGLLFGLLVLVRDEKQLVQEAAVIS